MKTISFPYNSENILLGCTEIPLSITEKEYRGVPILNASWMLAYELVRLADASKLKPYS